jgi:hypothetical protein
LALHVHDQKIPVIHRKLHVHFNSWLIRTMIVHA